MYVFFIVNLFVLNFLYLRWYKRQEVGGGATAKGSTVMEPTLCIVNLIL